MSFVAVEIGRFVWCGTDRLSKDWLCIICGCAIVLDGVRVDNALLSTALLHATVDVSMHNDDILFPGAANKMIEAGRNSKARAEVVMHRLMVSQTIVFRQAVVENRSSSERCE